MEIDEKIRNKLLEEAKTLKKTYVEILDEYLNNLSKSVTVEQLMMAKQLLLEDIILFLPLTAEDCYFCLVNNRNCKTCKYAKYHKICETRNSDWMKINEAQEKLLDTIDYYYKGERYN